MVPASELVVARIKGCSLRAYWSALHADRAVARPDPSATKSVLPQDDKNFYAVLLGRTVKSRTWVRMLDICIPFSCETNGSSSATNWSFINSLISS